MTDFKRETRYIVIKGTDIDRYLSVSQKSALASICSKICQGRRDDDRRELKAVVVESDWPEYNEVWKMIESRVNAENNTKTESRA